jgi:Calcineurin-like phosphoesterase superfamily domain
MPVAFFGGIYSNHYALRALLEDCEKRKIHEIYFLGDVGGFGPFPDRSVELLRQSPVRAMAGNYDVSIGNNLEDCGCGYTDPRDNHFAQLSYAYTLAHTSAENRAWLAALPTRLSTRIGGKRIELVHGSPRKLNEFLWESTTSAAFIQRLCQDCAADLILCTHTGIHWERRLPDGRGLINVGAIGRPENDGSRQVWYTLLHEDGLRTEFVPLSYDWESLATEMEEQKLPPEFVETIRTGWWTTCLEILPPKERRRGRL